jgi:small subunit ribosomal protein S8
VKLLKDEGFIKNFREIEGTPVGTLRVFLRYSQDGVPAISNIERVSKPGRRVYRKSDEIQPVRNGLGIGIVSTSQGLLTDAQARDRRVGGELLCQVW